MLGMATTVDGVSVPKIQWMDAIYSNLIELGIVKQETQQKDLAKILGWDEDSAKFEHLSTNWTMEILVSDVEKLPADIQVDDLCAAPVSKLSASEAVEIIMKLNKISPAHFVSRIG